MRAHLGRGRPDALFDSARWVRAFERGAAMAWERYAAGLPPGHIQVDREE
jgi:hypothetical protein